MGSILEGGGPDRRVTVGAVLLAAGAGSRLGGRPKCLLELDGVPLIRRALRALSGAGVDEVAVVLGHHADLVEPVVRDVPVTLVRNPRPDDGPVSSQRLGLAALSGRLDAVLVALADQPLLEAGDITALIGAWQKRPEGVQVVQPWVDGARANPAIFSAAVRGQILAGGPDVGCRQWQGAHPQAVQAWASDNRRYRVDIDTPEDLERVERETGQLLRWPAGLAPDLLEGQPAGRWTTLKETTR